MSLFKIKTINKISFNENEFKETNNLYEFNNLNELINKCNELINLNLKYTYEYFIYKDYFFISL